MSCIVEGHGEVTALPVLLRRLVAWRSPGAWIDVQHPIRVPRDKFLNKPNEFQRYVELAGGKSQLDGWILIILDADDDCPVELAANVIERARQILAGHNISVVIPNREFEAWFIAGAAGLNGQRGLEISDPDLLADPEHPRDAKGWLGCRMPDGYGETVDQPAFSANMDLDHARVRSRSFRKLCDEWDRYFARIDTQAEGDEAG